MSELVVGSLKGLAANSFVIDVASGSKIVQPGAVLQVVSTTKTDTFSMASSTFATVTGLSATITPTSASSKILVLAQVTQGVDPSTESKFRLSGGNSAAYVGDTAGSRIRAVFGRKSENFGSLVRSALSNPLQYLDSPNTTSAVTYSVECSTTAGTVFVNRSNDDTDNTGFTRGASTITLMEIAG
jgi:hypothetical protein